MKTKYRNLQPGDVFAEGDEAKSVYTGGWTNIDPVLIGTPADIDRFFGATFRRPVFDDVTGSMLAATKRARARTSLGKLEKLLAERTKWQRRQTIATTKLAAVQKQLDRLANDLASDRFDSDLNSST